MAAVTGLGRERAMMATQVEVVLARAPVQVAAGEVMRKQRKEGAARAMVIPARVGMVAAAQSEEAGKVEAATEAGRELRG